MRLSTRLLYGVRALLNLARHNGHGPLSVAAIAQRENISLPYLEQLLNRLRKHGLVDSVRGPKGGYLLSRAPEAIPLSEIVQALEGDWLNGLTDDATQEDGAAPSPHAVNRVWRRVGAKLTEALATMTLQDMAEEANMLDDGAAIEHTYTFHI